MGYRGDWVLKSLQKRRDKSLETVGLSECTEKG